jgi:hypothetical protein
MSAISNREDTPKEDRTLYWHLNRFLERHLPERLYARSLIIVIAPMVLLQGLDGVGVPRPALRDGHALAVAVVRA